MVGLPLNIAIASAIFFAVTLVTRAGDVMASVFATVIFAMVYGAFQVAVIVFGKGSE